jgi:uncharacterized RDD family membrane protein YckC
MGDRLIALILDTVVVAAFFAAFGMWYSVGRGGVTEGGFSLSGAPAVIVMLVCLSAAFLYYWLLEGWFGATLGKTIAGIRVLDKNGCRCGLKGSLVRNLLRIVDAIAVYLVGFLVAVFSKLRQRVGDHAAGTVVVEYRPHAAVRGVAVALWLALIAGGVAGAVLIHRQAPPVTPSGVAATETPSPARAAPASGAEAPAGGTLSNLRVSSTGDMKIAHFDFLQREDGPSRPYAPYAPGDTVYIEYKVTDFARDSESRMKVDLEAVTNDPNGLPIHRPWTRQVSQSSDGTPLNGSYSVTIPVFAPAGEFEYKLGVNDQIGDTKLELLAKLMVEAPPIAPADGLEIRDFALSPAKGGEAASPPVLQGGGTVYMRCNLFGIQLRDDVADIQMAFKVTGPDGEVLLDRPDYLHDRDTYVYHPPTFYLPITGHLSVPSGVAKGTYTLQYTVRDNLANSQVVQRGVVEVR